MPKREPIPEDAQLLRIFIDVLSLLHSNEAINNWIENNQPQIKRLTSDHQRLFKQEADFRKRQIRKAPHNHARQHKREEAKGLPPRQKPAPKKSGRPKMIREAVKAITAHDQALLKRAIEKGKSRQNGVDGEIHHTGA